MTHGNGVPVSGWHILDNAESEEVKAAARELIVKEVQAIRTIKQARKYVDHHSPDKPTKLHLWTTWVNDKNHLECTSLRELATGLRDTLPEIQCLVVIAWCAVTDLSHYGRKDGEYPRKALCTAAYQILCDKQNEVARLKEAEAIKALQGGIR